MRPLITLGALVLAGTALPQDYTIRTDARLVLLDASVTRRDGSQVAGLTKDQFRVFDNGRPVEITSFANQDVPVTVGLIVDESSSMTAKRPDVLRAATTFIDASNPHDEVFVLHFNETVQPGLPAGVLFSDNSKQLRSALYKGFPGGRTALYDAIEAGLKQLEKGTRERKTLVVISDGGDNASHITRQQSLDEVEKSAATIYTVGIYDEGDPDRDPATLQRLAKISGGQTYLPDSVEGLIPVCQAIAADIRARYTIGFRPPEPDPKHPEHSLRLQAFDQAHKGLKVRTRTGYWNEATNEARNQSP